MHNAHRTRGSSFQELLLDSHGTVLWQAQRREQGMDNDVMRKAPPRLCIEELRAAAIDYTPRPRGKNALRVSCGCRSIRVFPTVLVMGDIVCGACGSVFA